MNDESPYDSGRRVFVPGNCEEFPQEDDEDPRNAARDENMTTSDVTSSTPLFSILLAGHVGARAHSHEHAH